MDELKARRFPLGTLPTPLQRHDKLAQLLGLDELWIKRDDLTGFTWGGNKVRTVEYLLGHALEQGATTVVMSAGPSSNFAACMAAAAVGHGLAVEQVCYGRPPERTPLALLSSLALGVAVHYTGDDDRSSMEVHAAARAAALSDAGQQPYVVPRGGATAVGSLGFLNAAVELRAQLATEGPPRCTLVLPVGSGGSISGLLAGRALLDQDWQLLGVSVSRPASSMAETVIDHAVACAAEVGRTVDSVGPVHIVDGRGSGFGRSSPEEVELAATVERSSGLLIDPVYGAKALRWLADAAVSGPVLYWHTGGTLAVADRLRGDRPAGQNQPGQRHDEEKPNDE